jgi:hypothetical protein
MYSKNESSFFVQFMFREGATWQGQVHWLETGQKRSFRSCLELTLLLKEAMEMISVPAANYCFRSWQFNDDDQENCLIPELTYSCSAVKNQD